MIEQSSQQKLIFQLSEDDERVVRTYECTRMKRWFLPETLGYLTITNRRIVFHSTGKSLTGTSLLVNEMPVQDAAGISVYQGVSINWILFIILTVVAYFLTQIIANALPSILTGIPFAIILMLPAIGLWILGSDVVSSSFRKRAIDQVNKITSNRFPGTRDLSELLPYSRIPFYIGLTILIWRITADGLLGLSGSMIGNIVMLAGFGFIIFSLFGRQQSFSLAVASRTAKANGIYIPGDTFRLFSGSDNSAFESLSAGPSVDANQVVRELGAMLMDLQRLGNDGIQKWTLQLAS